MQVKANKKIGSCGCGRSPTGNCIGWHGLTESVFQAKLTEYLKKELDNNSKTK